MFVGIKDTLLFHIGVRPTHFLTRPELQSFIKRIHLLLLFGSSIISISAIVVVLLVLVLFVGFHLHAPAHGLVRVSQAARVNGHAVGHVQGGQFPGVGRLPDLPRRNDLGRALEAVQSDAPDNLLALRVRGLVRQTQPVAPVGRCQKGGDAVQGIEWEGLQFVGCRVSSVSSSRRGIVVVVADVGARCESLLLLPNLSQIIICFTSY